MQTFPEPPKSYSLIKNLLPSVSLMGETSQIEGNETDFRQDPHISSEVHSLIHAAQNSSLHDLKQALNIQLLQLQKLSNPSDFNPSEFLSDDILIERLKQLKLITEVMVERMNEKYKEAQNSFRQLDKIMKEKNKKIGVRSFFYWKRSNQQQKINKIDESQSTQKKAVIFNDKDQERLMESDRKRTRKQQEKERSLRVFSKKE